MSFLFELSGLVLPFEKRVEADYEQWLETPEDHVANGDQASRGTAGLSRNELRDRRYTGLAARRVLQDSKQLFGGSFNFHLSTSQRLQLQASKVYLRRYRGDMWWWWLLTWITRTPTKTPLQRAIMAQERASKSKKRMGKTQKRAIDISARSRGM